MHHSSPSPSAPPARFATRPLPWMELQELQALQEVQELRWKPRRLWENQLKECQSYINRNLNFLLNPNSHNVGIGARLGYHPHIVSTTAGSIAKCNAHVARQSANEEKQSCFFLNKRVVSPMGDKKHTMAAGSHFLAAIQNV